MARPITPTVGRIQLARELKRLRTAAKMTLAEAGRAIDVSAATLHRIESGAKIPAPRDVRDLCILFGASRPETAELMELAVSARQGAWWESIPVGGDKATTYVGLEAAASEILAYEGMRIPGLLQTPDYIHEYMVRVGRSTPAGKSLSESDIQSTIEARLKRQQDLLESSTTKIRVILDEAALRRPVGTPEVFSRQIEHLATVSRRRTVDLRVIPFSAGAHPGMDGVFSLLKLAQAGLPDTVFIEGLVGALFLDDPDDVSRYESIFASLRRAALTQQESRVYLDEISQSS